MNYVDPRDLHSHWDFVRKGLEKLLSKCVERWKPEDIYHGIKSKNYWLYVDHDAFCIVYIVPDWDGPAMFVLAAYVESGEAMGRCFPFIKEAAAHHKCKRIRFGTTRKGWERHALKLGYTMSHQEYEYELV